MKHQEMHRREFMKGAVAVGAGLGAVAQAQEAAQAPATGPKQVPRKKLGSTGVDIPIILMGCCQKLDPQYDKRLHRAYKLGVDYLDTAQMYADGQSHKTIAPFIKQIGDRKKLFIASKVFMSKAEASPEGFKRELDSSLAELETDYLDLFYLHMAHDPLYVSPPYLKMAEELKKAGKIRFFGITVHDGTVPQMLNEAAKAGSGAIDAVMFRYNFRQYGDKELNTAIDACKQAGLGLVAMKTLAAIPDDAEEIVPFKSDTFNLVQAKLKSVWADQRIDAVASQMMNVQQVIENTAAAMTETQLTMSEFHQLNQLAARTAHLYCTGCQQHCENRVEGPLRIADTMRYLMYYQSYPGQQEEAKRLYARLRPEERDFEQLDLGEAARACPQGIDIARRLGDAKRMLSA